MADDKPPIYPDAELPEPDASPFFFGASAEPTEPEAPGAEAAPDTDADADAPAAAPADAAEAAAEPADAAEAAAEPADAADVEPAEPADAAEADAEALEPEPGADAFAADESAGLGSTAPHDFTSEVAVDPAALQFTQLLEPVEAAEIPPFDPEAAQLTQVVPVVGVEPPAEQPPVFTQIAVTTVIAGSRVVMVVSRGQSPIPPNAVNAMPHVIGMPQGEALGRLQEAGLSAQVFNEFSELPRGEVIGQTPQYGESAAAGSEAVLLVSGGPAPAETLMVPLPDVVGLSEADALAKVQAAGLAPQVVRDFSPNVPLGIVIDQLPSGHSIAEAPRKKGSLWWLWTLLVIAVLVAMGGAAYYWMNRTAAVPNLVGLSQAQAEQAITAAGFKLGSIGSTQTVSATEIGKVVTQTPAPDTQLKLVDQIDVVVSGGQKLFAVPDITGRPQAEARSVLTSAGLQVSSTTAYSTTVAKDSVISQSPGPGEQVPAGTTVGMTISLGMQNVQVPGVGGQTRSQAANSLKAANLSSAAVVEYTLTGTQKGLVFGQYPTAGMTVTPGTIVGILVSNGPPSSGSTATVSVPSVVGLTKKKAITTLTNSTLGNTTINWSGTGRPAGEVVGQAPEAGSYVPKKVAVILFVSNGK